MLNKSIIVKHRLRDHERDLFDDYRTNATKIILPIDRADLRSGGRYVFIGQRGYEAVLKGLVGDGLDAQIDRKTLEILGRIPSFDPFLLREHLRQYDLHPAACYFDVSLADLRRMFEFLKHELKDLVALSMVAQDGQLDSSAATLAHKILSNTAVEEMEPLRLTLRLERDEYLEGVFCWKGFLYYKWKLDELSAGGPALVAQLKEVAATGSPDPVASAYVKEARARVVEAIEANRAEVAETLAFYDRAYRRLTQAGDPLAFRDFLLQAPAMFLTLGERLGVIDHIVSFWTFRFPANRLATVTAGELMDIFLDFEESLGSSARTGRPAPVGLAPVALIA
jgi:hypothetical protein